MTTKLIDVELRATGAKSAAKSLAKEVKSVGKSADSTSRSVSILEKGVIALKRENSQLSKSLSTSTSALSKAQKESEKLAVSQEKARAKAEKLAKSEENAAHALAIAMQKMQDLAGQTAKTEKQQAALNKRNETASARVATLSARHDDLIAKSQAARDRVKQLGEQEGELSKKIKNTTSEIDKNKAALKSSNKELNNASSGLDKLKARNQAASSAIAKTTKVVRTLSKSAVAVAAAIAAATAAATAATVAMVKSSADANRELETMAKLVGITTTEFNALAFATSQYGVSAEQISDISKDVGEKVAEFAAAGTGAFQDYADVMKLSATEAQAAALEFEKLSGDQVLKEVVKNLEAAGVSGGRVSFVLESLGSDATKLIPLLTKNSAELERLTGGFNSLNNQLSISASESGDLKKVSETFDLLSGTATQAKIAISSQLAPAVSEAFSDIAKLIPPATKELINFINAFRDPSTQQSVESLEAQIKTLKQNLIDLSNSSFLGFDLSQTQGTEDAIQRVIDKIGRLQGRITELQSVSKAAIFEGSGFANADVAGEVEAARAGAAGSGLPAGQTNVKEDATKKAAEKAAADAAARAAESLEALKANLALETEALQRENAIRAGIREGAINAEIGEEVLRFSNKSIADTARFEAEIAKLTEDEAVKKELRLAFQEQQLEEARIFEGNLTEINREESDKRQQKNREEQAERDKAAASIRGTAINLGASLLKAEISGNAKTEKEKKRARKKAVIIDTAAGIAKTFGDLGYPAGIPAALALAATGIANIATINSASGSPSTGASGADASSLTRVATTAPTPQAQQVESKRVIDLRGLEDGQSVNLNREQLIALLETDDDVIIASNNGQSEASRLGVI